VKPILCVCLAVVVAACSHAPKEAAVSAPWNRIDIADGSSNDFQFRREASGRVQFVYVPITRAQSSSGMYDGGPPRKEELAADEARLIELWSLLQKLEADTAKHQPDRNKGTGAISWDGANGKHEFIVEMNAPQLNELWALLKKFGA
jgi:hypothetical protein